MATPVPTPINTAPPITVSKVRFSVTGWGASNYATERGVFNEEKNQMEHFDWGTPALRTKTQCWGGFCFEGSAICCMGVCTCKYTNTGIKAAAFDPRELPVGTGATLHVVSANGLHAVQANAWLVWKPSGWYNVPHVQNAKWLICITATSSASF